MGQSPSTGGRLSRHSLNRAFAVLCATVFMLLAPSRGMATIVHFDTSLGDFDVQLFDAVAPQTVANFLNYVTSGSYTDSIIHRVDPGTGVIQGGGYYQDGSDLATAPAIPLEYSLPNTRGTISMARTVDLNSATSQWFINTKDNSTSLGPANDGGYAVFGQVLGNGMNVVDAIAAVQTFPFNAPFGQLPLLNFTTTDFNNQVDPHPHVVFVNSVTVVPEPSTIALAGSTLIVGLGGFAIRARSRRAKQRR